MKTQTKSKCRFCGKEDCKCEDQGFCSCHNCSCGNGKKEIVKKKK
ncbi:MAG: hypothetical protein AABW51_03575 [Nanoarchaeota archaeon]